MKLMIRSKRTALLGTAQLLLALVGLVLNTTQGTAQGGVPQAVNYQGVLRKSDGSAQGLQDIAIRLSIVSDTVKGTELYIESHTVQTDDLGLFSVELGKGRSAQRFVDVPWGAGSLWLNVSIDEDAGGPLGYVSMGRQEIVSVPYAIYAGRSGSADTAKYVQGFALGFGLAYSDNKSLHYLAPSKAGYLLVSTGDAKPEWRSISDLVDGPVMDTLIAKILRDSTFIRSTVDTVAIRLGNDTSFIHTIANDSTLRKMIVRIVDSTLTERPYYREIRDSLLRDILFRDSMTVIIRDELIRDRIFLENIGRDSVIQRLIASSTTFTNSLFANAVFRDSLSSAIQSYIGDLTTQYWSTGGNANTDPTKNYLGTNDGTDLVIKTDRVERLRVTRDGKIGIGTGSPTYTLDINGTANLTGELRINGDPGNRGYMLVSNGTGEAPVWAEMQASLWDISGEVLLEPGTTAVTINAPVVTERTRIVLTIEDLDDSGFVFAQVVKKQAGMFRVRLSAPVVSRSSKLSFILINE